jgi:hypothetical protein
MVISYNHEDDNLKDDGYQCKNPNEVGSMDITHPQEHIFDKINNEY